MEKIAAIYTRVSTKDQAEEGYSLSAQERTLMNYCKSKHIKVFKVYSDEGISGKDIKHRPAMMELLSDAFNNCFNMILVWKLTRFSRRLSDLIGVCEKLDAAGIALVSYSEAFDSLTPAGRMMRSMLGTVAQFEREVIGENVSAAMLERAQQGKRTCSELLGYDLCGKDSFCINEKEKEYVNFCFSTYLIRKSLTEVAQLARERGYRGKRGAIPTAWTVFKILTRTQYAGYNLYKGVLYKGNYKSIRTVEDFNKVQRLLIKQGKIVGRTRMGKIYILPEEKKNNKEEREEKSWQEKAIRGTK